MKKIMLILIIVLIVLAFFLFHFIRDRKVVHEFCCSSFNGTIKKIETNIKGYKSVLLESDNWYHLSNFFKYNQYHLEEGDSIVKKEGNLKIMIYKNHNIVYESSINNNFNCKCECEE
jgi:hypothetical protein